MKSLSATTKLTIAYLGILMVISLAFSIVVYRSSVAALEEGFLRQARVFQGQPGFNLGMGPPRLNQIRIEELAQAKQDILIDLLGINVAILVLAGLGSYWLAGRTLRPIEESLEAQSRFTADASHELRTPLTSMQTEIEVALRDKKLTIGEAKNLLESNLEEIAKLRALADGLLSLSRYQSGEQVSFTTVSLKEVSKEAMRRLDGVTQHSQAKLAIDAQDVMIQADFESLVSLLVILIDNAIKYSQAKPEVRLGIRGEGKAALIQVADKGIGIKASDIPHIFDRFFRADTSRSKLTNGYGLGLSIAKQIVQMHNGTIKASSTPSEGTLISVKLPVTQPKTILPV